MKQQDLVTVRAGSPSDYNFILATWLRSAWYSKDNPTTLKKPTFMRAKHVEIDNALRRSVVLVAALKEDADTIVGYAVFTDDKPVWIYVRKAWRAIGISTLLKQTFTNTRSPNETGEELPAQ